MSTTEEQSERQGEIEGGKEELDEVGQFHVERRLIIKQLKLFGHVV